MKLNFRNLNESDKRVKVTPKTSELPIGPSTPVNPTLGINDAGVLTFCLSKAQFSCAGAIPNSGLVDLEGEFDVLVDGVIVASGISAEDLPTYLDGTDGIEFEPYQATFTLPVYNPLHTLTNVNPPEFAGPYEHPYFRIENPNGFTTDVGFTLYGQIVPGGENPADGQINYRGTFAFETPKDIPIDKINGNGPWVPEFQDLFSLSEALYSAEVNNLNVCLYAYKNIQNNRYGWIVMVWDSNLTTVPSSTYFHIDEMGTNFTLPVIDGGGDMVATNDNLDNSNNVAISSMRVPGMQEGILPPPPPPPPELIPPPGVLDWIALSSFGYHNVFINNESIAVKTSTYGYIPSRNNANVNNMLYSLRTAAGIEGFAVLSSVTGEMTDVILMNTRDEPVHVKFTRNPTNTPYDVAAASDNQNDSFNRDDSDTVHFWLGSKAVEEFTPFPVTGTYGDNYCGLKAFTSANGNPSLKDFYIAYLDDEEITRGYPLRTKALNRTEQIEDTLYSELLDIFIDAGKKLGRVPFWAYGTPPSTVNPPTIFENLHTAPVSLRLYFPMGIPAYIQPSQNNSIEVSNRSVLINFAPRKLVVDVKPSPSAQDGFSINLRREFRRKYQWWMRDALEVEFNITRNLTPKIQPMNAYGEKFAFEPVCLTPNEPLTSTVVSSKVSAIFIGRVPPINKDGNEYGLEDEWHQALLPTKTVRDYWGDVCTINLNIYSTIYGLGGSGGFRRRYDNPQAYVYDGGDGFAPITNFDDNVNLLIRVKSTGKVISGGGGGPSQPTGTMVGYSRRRQLLPDGSGGSMWSSWTPWVSTGSEPVPNNGGGGGMPNGLDGAYRYSSTGPLLPIPGVWWMPYIGMAVNTANGAPPFFGFPYEYKRLPAFNIRAKGAAAGSNWSSNVPVAPVWHIPEAELYNATEWGTWSTWTKAEMTAEIPLGPNGAPSLEGGFAGPLVTGNCSSITVESGGYVMADWSNSPNIIYE